MKPGWTDIFSFFAVQNQAIIADVEIAETPLEEPTSFTTPKTIKHDSPFVKRFEHICSERRKNLTKKGLSNLACV